MKEDAILGAVNQYNQRRKLEKLSSYLGTFESLISKNDLMSLRNEVGISVLT